MKLRIKIPFIYAVLIAALGTVFILFTSRMVEERMFEEEREYFESLTKTLALNSANAIVLKDYAAIRGIVDNITKGEHVSYAIILDENGMVLAHSMHDLEGKVLNDPLSLNASATNDLLMQPIGSDIMDVTAPLMIAGKKWGAVRIGFSLSEMNLKVAKAKNLILFAGLIAIFIGAAVSILIAKKITDPIHKLHKGTEIIGGGNLDYRVDISTGDEIEQLAKAFNTMTGHIQDNYLALSESEEKYRKLIESANDAVFVADAETGLIIETNKRAEELLGRPINEIIGMYQTELHPKEDAGFYANVFKEHIQKGEAVQTDLFVAHKDGRKIPVEISASVSEIKGRKIITGIFRDITERKKAEETLRKSEASLAEAQRIAHLGNWNWDILKNELRWSDEIYRIFGLRPQEFGATYEAFLNSVHPEDRDFVKKSVNESLYKKMPYSIDHRIVLPDSSIRFVHEQAEVTFDDKGRPVRMIGTVHDITDRKKADEELHELFVAALTSLAAAIEAKSPWTKGHSERVTEYALQIGRDMGLSDEDMEELRIAALLHDIGKIGTYDDLIDKPGKLTYEEYEMVKRHSKKGEDLLMPIKQLRHIIPWIKGHHERYDGKGYPDGLKSEEIPLQARILAVADTFDSMTAERPYRKMPGREKAIEELKGYAGSQFDPKVVEAFLRAICDETSMPTCRHKGQ